MAAAAKHLTPVVLELGGKSPVIVDSAVNLEVKSSSLFIFYSFHLHSLSDCAISFYSGTMISISTPVC